jgi:large subunit ribosomal protein L15
MALHTLPKLVRHKKRRGRGIGSRGAKSGRGMKGQKSRAGYHRKAGFEGGQTPLYMRLPKGRGSKQKFPSQVVPTQAVTTKQLNRFAEGANIGFAQLLAKGLITDPHRPVRLIGNDSVTKKLTITVHAASPSAQKQVEAAGGNVRVITQV